MPGTPITSGSLFVVSGGARGVTAKCVVGIAQRFGCRFLLLGRSPAGPPSAWAEGQTTEAALMQGAADYLRATGERPTPAALRRLVADVVTRREVAATLADVVAAGGFAEYVQVDITDGPALRAALAEAQAHLGPVTGVIHGAGVLADKRIEQKRAADFDAVYAPKITGLAHLLACLPPARLQHLVLFASAAGFYGNPGQADYAIVNEMLNRAAYLIKRAHPNCHTVALNWGPWDGGMVTPALKELFAQRGVAVIPVEAGVARLVDELALPADHPAAILVGSPLPPPPEQHTGAPRAWQMLRRLSLETNPFLHDHRIGGHAVLPATCGIAWLAHGCEQLLPGYHVARCEGYQVLKGIVFDDTLAPTYRLEVRELPPNTDELHFDALVSSEAQGKPRYHYKAHVVLRQRLPDQPHFPQMDLAERNPIPGSELYARGVLFHGPRLQGVERVLNSDAHGLTMRCRMPALAERDQGQFPARTLNPFCADVQFQSLVIWAWQQYGAASLPLSLETAELFCPVPLDRPFFVTMEMRKSDEYRLRADLTAHDEQGAVFVRLSGAEVTISRQLNRLFAAAM